MKRLLCALFAAAFVACAGASRAQDSSGKIDLTPKLKFSMMTIKSDAGAVCVDVTYPKFGISAIDSDVDSFVKQKINDFISRAGAAPGCAHDPDSISTCVCSLILGSSVPYMPGKIASFTFNGTEFVDAKVNEMQGQGMVFNTSKGKRLRIEDVFDMNAGAMPALSKLIVKNFEQGMENPNREWILSFAGPDAANFQNFSISEFGMNFIFKPKTMLDPDAGEYMQSSTGFLSDLEVIMNAEFVDIYK